MHKHINNGYRGCYIAPPTLNIMLINSLYISLLQVRSRALIGTPNTNIANVEINKAGT